MRKEHMNTTAFNVRDSALGIIDQLLRDRSRFLARVDEAADLAPIARTLIITIAVCAAIFGGAVGAYRDGLQILFAAAKLPLVMLLTAGVSAPALIGFQRAVRGESSPLRDLVLVLASLALGALIIAAMVPVVLLALFFHVDYHAMVMIVVASCCVGGWMGLSMFARGIDPRGASSGRWMTIAASLVVFALVGTQMSWSFRPYLVRPRTESVPFLRDREGSFLDAVWTAKDSLRGVYHRDHAPLPEEKVAQ
jgi:hypothetical protein